jgi:hypothetical protein
MPIEWDVGNGENELRISGSGVMTTVVDHPLPHGIAPLLTLDRLTVGLDWKTPGGNGHIEPGELHALSSDQKLIAIVGDNSALAGQLFPGNTIIPIPIDSTSPLPGSGAAWESLDAVIVEAGTWTRISEQTKSALFAEGVLLAVVSDAKPNEKFNWNRHGSAWIAHSGMIAPPVVLADAYAPTYAWQPGRSLAYRRQIVLLGALVCIAAGVVALWRSRLMPGGQAVVMGITIAMVCWWNSRKSPISIMESAVCIDGTDQTVIDTWFFQSSRKDAPFRRHIRGTAHPIFFDQAQMAQSQLELSCEGNGEPHAIAGSLKGLWPLVMIDRSEEPGAIAAMGEIENPMRALPLRLLYPGCQVRGEYQGKEPPSVRWPALILRRRSN